MSEPEQQEQDDALLTQLVAAAFRWYRVREWPTMRYQDLPDTETALHAAVGRLFRLRKEVPSQFGRERSE